MSILLLLIDLKGCARALTKCVVQVGEKIVDIPNNAMASGTCGNTTDVLTLTWGKHKAVFTFHKIVNSSQYDLAVVALSFAADNATFPNVSQGK